MPVPVRLNPWLLAPFAVLTGVVLTMCQSAEVPDRAAWKAATDAVRAELKPSDGVAWAPYWAGEGRLFLHGLPGFHLPDVATADLARYERVWLLGAFGRSADDLPGGHTLLARRHFGQVTLDLVQAGDERVVGDIRAVLDRVRVSRVRGEGPKEKVDACDFWDGRGWHCELKKSPDATRKCLAQPVPRRLSAFKSSRRRRGKRADPHCGKNPWLHVSRDTRVIGDAPRRCVWFHPVAGKTLRLEWPDAPRADTLVVDYGFTDKVTHNRTRDGRVKPATLKALRDGVEIGRRRIDPVWGWHRWRIAASGTGPLTLELSTTSHVDAHLCIDPTLREANR